MFKRFFPSKDKSEPDRSDRSEKLEGSDESFGVRTSMDDLADSRREPISEPPDELAEGVLKEALASPTNDAAIKTSPREAAKQDEPALLAEIAELKGHLNGLLVDAVAQRMAEEISVAPSLLVDSIKARLKAEIDDGKAFTQVLDLDGKPSEMTLDDLKAELIGNPAFAPIVIGSRASGSGAARNQADSLLTLNPWRSESRNLTEQGRIYKQDPALAAMMAEMAGQPL